MYRHGAVEIRAALHLRVLKFAVFASHPIQTAILLENSRSRKPQQHDQNPLGIKFRRQKQRRLTAAALSGYVVEKLAMKAWTESNSPQRKESKRMERIEEKKERGAERRAF